MKRLFALPLLVLLAATLAPAQTANDVLYLQDGRERVGKLVSISADTIIFWVEGEDQATTFVKEEIQRVDLSRQRMGDDVRNVADLEDPLLQRILEHQPSKIAFPDSGHVVLYQLFDYYFDDNNQYTLHERHIEKILLERGKDQANVARYYKKGEETLEIDFARTINPDGSITPISDAAVDTASVYANNPEYEKLQQVKFAMKQVKEGSILDYQTTKVRTNSLLDPFLTSMLFRDDEPIMEAELRINVPRGCELLHREDRLGDNVEFTREEKGDRVIYRYVAKQCPRVVPESMMPPANDVYPRVTASLATTWDAIGQAFGEAMRQSNSPSDEIKAKVAELIAGASDQEERARRIYHYFTEAINHQWVRPQNYSYAPRPVSNVFAKRSGNSLDKALLLCVMLEEAGLPAGVVLACPQGSGKLLEDVPNIRQFDDALVAVTLPSGRRFLPLYDESVRFGQMTSRYQSTRGLLVTADGSEMVTIPLNPPEDELYATEYRVRVMPSGDLTVLKTETLTGNNEINRRNAWKDMKEEELRRSFEVQLTGMYSKARLDKYTIENLHDVTQPLKFTQEYTLVDYAMRAGDDLLVFQLPEIDYGAASVGKPSREFPLKWWQRSKTINTMTVEIPPGFRIYYAGKDYQANCDVAVFNATFTSSGRDIRYSDDYVQSKLEAPSQTYGDYKACIETRARVSKEWIVLERATAE